MYLTCTYCRLQRYFYKASFRTEMEIAQYMNAANQKQQGFQQHKFKQRTREGEEIIQNISFSIDNRNNNVSILKTSQVIDFSFELLTQERSLWKL